jgi:hypothetical protein
MRFAAGLVLLAMVSACHRRPAEHEVAPGTEVRKCTVDGEVVYAVTSGRDRLVRISRDGHVDSLTDKTSFVSDIVAIDGVVYWIDTAGVHSWTVATSRREDLFPTAENQQPHSLVVFRSNVCWSIDGYPAYTSLIECVDRRTHERHVWSHVPGSEAFAATYGGKLYAATIPHDPPGGASQTCTYFDVTLPEQPTQLGSNASNCFRFNVTSLGPSVWDDGVRVGSSLTPLGSGTLQAKAVGSNTYVLAKDRLFRVAPDQSLEPITDHQIVDICGDASSLYMVDDAGRLLR